jgi:aspartate aminotransferase
MDAIQDDVQLSEYLLDKAGVALVSGMAFSGSRSCEDFIRYPLENLHKALDRIKTALNP